MKNRRVESVLLSLDYYLGIDDAERGIFRNFPVEPKHTDEIVIAIRNDLDEDGETVLRPQVHLAGSAKALEQLGRYLIALARLETSDPEPYGSFDDVRNADGGTVRLIPRRLNSF